MAKESKSNVKKAAKAKAKKRWLEIIGPKSFDNVPLGETHVVEPQQAIGKTVNANLMNLTGDMRKQGIQIRFDIVNVSEGKAQAAVTGYELLPSYLKRLVRRGRSKVADSFVARTATGRLVRIKPIIITANRASAGAQTQIRLVARERLKQLAGAASFDRLVQDLIGFRLQRAVKEEVNRLHPIKGVEVKAFILLPEGTSEKREVRADSRVEDFVEVKEEAAVENEEEMEAAADEASEDVDNSKEADDGGDSDASPAEEEANEGPKQESSDGEERS